MAEPVETVHDLAWDVQEGLAIPIVVEDVFLAVASGGHMVDRTIKLDPERPRHEPPKYQNGGDLTLKVI